MIQNLLNYSEIITINRIYNINDQYDIMILCTEHVMLLADLTPIYKIISVLHC